MEKLYRIIIIRFDYLSAKCLFPIILNWEETSKATYEIETMNKIISQLESALGISNVRLVHNRVSTYQDLKNEFDSVIGDIKFNTVSSNLKTLSVDLKRFKPLNQNDIDNGIVEKFELHNMHFPVKISSPGDLTIDLLGELPMLVIEE